MEEVQNGLFAKHPALTWRVNIPIKDFDLTLSFVGDVDGDGFSDLLVRARAQQRAGRVENRAHFTSLSSDFVRWIERRERKKDAEAT